MAGTDAPHARPSRWQRRPAISRRVDDGVIVAPPDPSVEPVLLTGPGPLIWDLLAEPSTVAQLSATLAERFDRHADELDADVTRLIEQLEARDLLTRVPS